MGNIQYRSVLRFIAGGYLVYMGYQLLERIWNVGDVDRPMLIGAFGVGFILFGVGLILFEMRLIKKEYEAENTPLSEADAEVQDAPSIEEVTAEAKEEKDEET